MIYDPRKHFEVDDRARNLTLAHLHLKNSLAQKTLARTPEQTEEAQTKVAQAQRELSSLYLDYIQSAKVASQDPLPLDAVLAVVDVTE